MTEPTMADFAGLLLEYLVGKTGTTKLRALQTPNGTTFITMGARNFQGDTLEAAFDQALDAVLKHYNPTSFEEYARLAAQYEAADEAKLKELIHELTKDGLTDLGKATEEMRQARQTIILNALALVLKEKPLPRDLDDLLDKTRRMSLDDLEPAELNEALKLLTEHTTKQ